MKACLLITCPLLIGLVIIINGTWPTKPRNQNTHVLNENIIVLRPSSVAGPVQGPGSGFWAGHQVGRVNSFFIKKSKRHRLVKKTKVNGFATGLAGSTRWVIRVTPGFSFSHFFFNPPRFQPRVGRVLGRPTGPGQVSKLCPNQISFIKKPKPNQNRFKQSWLGFFGLARFFFVWLDFFRFDSVFFWLGSIRFFQFQAYKTETEPNRSIFLIF